jgi:hypothetical protein
VGIGDYFDERSIHYFESENEQSLADSIYKVYKNEHEVNDVIDRSYEVYKKNTWELQKENLIKHVINLAYNN